MTARDTIARTLLASVDLTMAEVDDPREVPAAADELIAAVRAMPVEEQAELIGGTVTFREPRETDGEHFFVEVGR